MLDDNGQTCGPRDPGAVAFRLYDTYGFPFSIDPRNSREQILTVDER